MKAYFKKSFEIFIKSFRDFDRRIILAVLYDLIFYFILILAAFVFFKLFTQRSLEIGAIQLDQIGVSQEIAQQTLDQLKSFIFFVIATPIILGIIIFVAMSLCKVLIWFQIARKKATLKGILSFMGIRAILGGIGLAGIIISTPLFFLIYFAIQIKSIFLLSLAGSIFFLGLLFLTNIKNIAYILYTEEQKVTIIKKAFVIGAKKAHLFILPYIMTAVMFLIVTDVYYYTFKFIFGSIIPVTSPPLTTAFFYIVIPFIIFFIWFRIYFYGVFKSLSD
jgi:hypothetical protein